MTTGTDPQPAPASPAPVRLLLTPEDAAERLSLSRTMVYELIRTGELRSVKIGRARRVPVTALGEYVARLTGGPT